MNIISLFSGIGAFEKALSNLNKDFNIKNYCEFDKFASESYSAIHNIDKTLNLGDITKVDISKLEKGCADLITYGFPCQDISNAGKQKGFKDENGNITRSGLFFYATSIIGRIQPKIAIAENVKALTSKKFKNEFATVLSSLEELGYNNYYKILNAKDYGIPQNRERVFIVSIRKDIDNKLFEFPKPFSLEKKVKDMLEDEVDEYFYNVCPSMIKAIEEKKVKDITNSEYCSTLTTKQARWNNAGMITDNNRLRYLSCIETWRLMGFDDEDCEKSRTVLNNAFHKGKDKSNNQLYKQAGNSIVVNVLMELFKSIYKTNLL